MGKSNEKKYVIIPGYRLRQSNRGNAALAYGTVTFLLEKGWLREGQEIVRFLFYNNPLKKRNRTVQTQKNVIDGIEWTSHVIPVHRIQVWILNTLGILIPFTRFRRIVRQVEYEAADYGGDGFSDIYGDRTYMSRFNQTLPLWKLNIPLIVLPQTIGPFKKKENYDLAVKILKRAKHVFVRDSKFEDELKKLDIPYERTKDLSAFMKPEPWDIDIKDNAIGINVSGLAYSNRFRDLAGQFDSYPKLIDRLICHFHAKGHTVYLIPHSYNYEHPEDTNDDIVACRDAYDRLENKDNVVFVDNNLISPRVKYVISRMSFFIGTRMHANFAAIYTNVPLFGLAYSYKFEGAFNANGLDGAKQTVMINNIKESDIDGIIQKIDGVYRELVKK